MQNVLAIYRQLIYTEKELRKFKEKMHILNKSEKTHKRIKKEKMC